MRPLYYRLDDHHQPIPVTAHDPRFVSLFAPECNRRVADDVVGDYWISTVFLVIDHAWSEGDPPILFETMIFPKGTFDDLYCVRYATWEEAVAGHQRTVADVVAGRLPSP